MSLHHIVPKHRGWYPGKDKNTVELEDTLHNALHVMFWDASPVQQIQEILFFDAPKWDKFLQLSLFLWWTQKKTTTQVYKPGIVVIAQRLHLPISYHCKSPSKVLKAQWVLFWERVTTESKVQYVLSLWERSLQQDFSSKVLDVLW